MPIPSQSTATQAPLKPALLVYAAAGLLIAVVLGGLSLLALFERRAALNASLGRVELLARMLDDQATRTVEASALTLRTLGDSLLLEAARGSGNERLAELAQPQLAAALQGQPTLRALALLSEQGRVLASSEPGEIGRLVPLAALGALPAEGADRLAGLLPGRFLAELGQASTSSAQVQMLPLLYRLPGPAGRRLLLLALLNPAALANQQQLALGDLPAAAALASYEGRLLAATEAVPQAPGQGLLEHPVFAQLLATREHGSYLGAGLLPGPQAVAFRASRSRPLVVLVEQAQAAALAPWWDSLRTLLGLGLGMVLLTAGAAAVALRSLSARAGSERALAQAHARTAAREHDFRVLLRSLQELVFRTDASAAISFVNARWTRLSAQRIEQASGQRLADLVVPADRAAAAALFSPQPPLDQARHALLSVRSAQGELLSFDVSVLPLLDGQGRLSGFAGSAIDVSERIEAQQGLQHQLQFTGLLLEMSPLPVSMFDADGRYITVNQAWEDFTGRQRSDCIGQVVGGGMDAVERELHAEQDQRLLREGGRIRYETQVRHRDGSLRDMLITKVRVPDLAGGVAGILCTLMDVSEFREAERATLEARDVAQEASRAKSEFIANISHELRTPLQSILGFSELGLMRGREQPKLAGMFEDIQNAGQRMLALVNDLLDVAKIESSVGTFDLERCDLRSLIKAVLRELSPLVARRRLQLALSLPESPLAAQVDPLRFQQVIRNVCANAIKFSPEGGRLELRAGYSPQGEVQISVADQGPGIPEAELESIFEAFVQSSQTQDGSGGTGLGLNICRKIVEIHGGRIHAENRSPPGAAGSGAIFRISLPARVGGDSQLLSL